MALYADGRAPVINAHLADAPPGYVFLAGDSHAELASPALRLCGQEVVNGGISGARTSLYARVLGQLTFITPARAAILTIGTNDLRHRDKPLTPDRLSQFEEDAGRIIRQLQAHADLVMVTAIPPVDPGLAGVIDGPAGAVYSGRLEALCRQLGCRFADPFASLRGGEGLARPGTLLDGLHLARYRPALTLMEPLICGTAAASADADQGRD